MAKKARKKWIRSALLWQVGMWCMLFACTGFAVVFWYSGYTDTKDAFDTGRRVLVILDGGAIQGKQNRIDLPPIEVPLPEETPTEDTPPAEPNALSEPAAVTPPDPAEAPAAEPNALSEPAAVTPPAPNALSEPAAVTPPEAGAEPKMDTPAVTDAALPAEEEKIVPGEELPMLQEPEEVAAPTESVTIVPSPNPLPLANSDLMEKAEVGMLPVIGGDGTKAWKYYAKPFEREGKQPMIAIIITGLGQSKYVTEKALTMPENFSLSFSPYGKDVANWANTARLTGHEKLVDLPMEPSNYPASDPGPYGLIVGKGLKENEIRLQWLMSRFTGHIGFVTPTNEVYTHDNEALTVLLQSLANRGLMLVVAHEPAKTETGEILDSSSTPNLITDMLVDEDLLDTSIDTRLSGLEQLALKRGYAVGVIRATPLSIERLRLWSETLAKKEIVLAPVSAIVNLRF